MTILLANGCSHVFGSELSTDNLECLDKNFSAHLARHCGWQVRNISMPAGSNQRVIRTTINTLLDDYKDKFDEMFVMIMWTGWDRNELYQEHLAKQANLYPNMETTYIPIHPKMDYDLNYKDALSKEMIKQISNFYYTYFSSYQQRLDAWYNSVILMQDFLKNKNIPYIFCDAFNQGLIPLESQLSNIDQRRYPNLLKYGHDYCGYLSDKGFPRTTWYHYGEEAHLEWAKHLLTYINDHHLLDRD